MSLSQFNELIRTRILNFAPKCLSDMNKRSNSQ